MKLVWILSLLLFAAGVARADDVEVIELKHRTADQIIPTLRPLVEPGGALSGMQSTLVIRASRANIAQLRQAIATLDRTPRRLLISVRQDAAGSFDSRDVRVSGTVAGGDVRVGVNEPPRRESGVSISARESHGARTDRFTSQVQALEGSPAYIAIGQSVPVPETVVTQTPGGAVVRSTTTYRNMSSGVAVIPRLSGDRVFLDIAPQTASPAPGGSGAASFQRIVTTASGRLGEWFPLGGIDQSAVRSRSGVLSGGSDARVGASSVWVKVDEIQ
ncbi:MAG: secretin N-terminal domain-containing protein [Burkholderiales bacterium]